MSDLIYQFSQQPQTLLTDIGKGISQIGGGIVDLEKDKRYQGLLSTAMDPATTSPENWAIAMNAAPEAQKENALRTYQITEAERQRKEAAAARAAAEAKYSGAYRAYMDDPNKETLGAMYAASQPLGIFDSIGKTVEAMDTLQQTQQLQQMGEYYSMAYSGNWGPLEEKLESDILAYEAEGEKEEAKQLKNMLSQVREGQNKEVTALIGSGMGVIDGGVEMMENIHGMNAEVRKDIELGMAEEELKIKQAENKRKDNEFALKIMETGAELEKDQGSLNAMTEAARNDPEFGEITLAALNYATALKGGLGYDPTEFNDVLFSLGDKFQKNAKRYFDERTATVTLNSAIDHATSLANSADADPMDLGFADITAINLMQRQIDPATVREGDVHLIRQAQSLANQFKTMTKGWTSGAILSPDQRASFKELSAKIVEAQKAKVDEVYYPASHASFKRVVSEAGRNDNIDSLWTEVYSGYTPPGETVTSTEDPDEPDVFKTDSASFFGGS